MRNYGENVLAVPAMSSIDGGEKGLYSEGLRKLNGKTSGGFQFTRNAKIYPLLGNEV